MKKRLLLGLALIPTFVLLYALWRFREPVIQFVNVRYATAHVLMIGDSQTAYNDWNSRLNRRDILAVAAPRFTSQQVIGLTNEALSRQKKAAVAFVMAGTNNLTNRHYFRHELLADFHQIDSAIRASRIRPVFQTIPHRQDRPQLNAEIDSINQDLRAYCQREKVDLLDLSRAITPQHLTGDKIHINAAGYRVWQNMIEDYLSSHHF